MVHLLRLKIGAYSAACSFILPDGPPALAQIYPPDAQAPPAEASGAFLVTIIENEWLSLLWPDP